MNNFHLNHRSYLYVPATKVERVEKAFATGADAVILDWEDAVETSQKISAREATLAWLTQNTHFNKPIWLRINAIDTDEYPIDLSFIKHFSDKITGIFLPKTQNKSDIEHVYNLLSLPVIALIETAKGMLNIADIAQANGLVALSFGCLDLSNDLGMNPHSMAANTVFNRLRMDLLLHSIINQLNPPIDTVFPDFHHDEGLKQQVRFAHDLGMFGMMCIHPRQIAVLHEALQPNTEDLAFAKRVCEVYQQTGQVAFQLDGKMVDLPVIQRAIRLCQHYTHSNKCTI